jgi:hypothetical protein
MLTVHEVHDVRQVEIHMAEPLVPESSFVKVEIAIESWKGINPQVLLRFWLN